ncbi:MAG: 4,4'-diaponeurosporenoate glycosyltransferase [Chromatiales bacterium USCg_Taylor]|jgi:hopene-associated glycosyltransferase HpnB|nr:MAG: 4,4'-diaponeurosporenoate glycosyltransferase [Chromatiales bacterium USCg_Taylor]
MRWVFFLVPSSLIWIGILLAPWRPWRTDESLDAAASADVDLGDVTVLIPARNEAAVIQHTLSALARQGRSFRVVLIDDQSTDETVAKALAVDIEGLEIVRGEPLPPGWSGKLWALEQGRAGVRSALTLLLDADVALRTGILAVLRAKLKNEGNHLVSLMVELRMEGWWEKLLMPAFVFFFKLLYPFQLSNLPSSRYVAAAAGGCILVETRVLEAIGGFAAIKAELIDDCALAKAVKAKGFRTWLGLTRSASSLRAYTSLASIWKMVARTAYTQLRYSLILLVLCTAMMLLAFCVPVAGLLAANGWDRVFSLVLVSLAMASYQPTLKYYRQSRAWALTLPIIGLLYVAMTWSSAIRYWSGERSQWKGRNYKA